jgi:hypothetical protein
MKNRPRQVLGEIAGKLLIGAVDRFPREFCLEAPGRAGERTTNSGESCWEVGSAEILEKATELMKVAGVSSSVPVYLPFLCRQALFED